MVLLNYNIREHAQQAKQKFLDVQRYNLRTFRSQPLAEISGSLGDLGTLLPLLLALSHGYVSLSSTLVFAGLANILTGLFFGIPLPVQPMKAIAAVALARKFTKAEVSSAGLFVGGVVGFLSLTGLIRWFTRKIPIPVIKGIQVGTGLSLIIYGGNLVGIQLSSQLVNNLFLVIAVLLAFLALLGSPIFPRIPFALLILSVGILKSLPDGVDTHPPFGFGIWMPHISVPSPSSFRVGALYAGLGQIPLTTLNSIFAVSFLSADLLPKVPAPTPTSMGLSVMAMNLVGCWFGAMPVCHGSGGLAAQYRFGARSGSSVIFLGLVKLLLGLFAGKFASNLFAGFPNSLLSIMVIAAGLELANVGETLNTMDALDLREIYKRNQDGDNDSDSAERKDLTEVERKRRWAVMLITVGGILAFKNDAVGFLAGMLCHWSFEIQDRLEARRSQREGSIRLVQDSPSEESPILRHEDA